MGCISKKEHSQLKGLCDTLRGRRPERAVQFDECARIIRKLIAEIERRSSK